MYNCILIISCLILASCAADSAWKFHNDAPATFTVNQCIKCHPNFNK
jgi:hypothetical protein